MIARRVLGMLLIISGWRGERDIASRGCLVRHVDIRQLLSWRLAGCNLLGGRWGEGQQLLLQEALLHEGVHPLGLKSTLSFASRLNRRRGAVLCMCETSWSM
jgi:hypothetical protein